MFVNSIAFYLTIKLKFYQYIIMEHIKYVIDELNQVPFNQNLNLIAYDNLRDEQRLDLLIQILNVIDSKVW